MAGAREARSCSRPARIERPLVFPDNDRPGIMLADAARTYLDRYGVRARRARGRSSPRTTAPIGAALDLQRSGRRDRRDRRRTRESAKARCRQRAAAAGLPIQTGATITATRGRLRVSAVDVARLGQRGAVNVADAAIACDLVLMSGGWTPSRASVFAIARQAALR